jgi:PAS domain S-box-containing protein
MKAYKYYTLTNMDKEVLRLLETHAIVTVTDSLGRIAYASDNYCDILECHAHEIIGEPHELLKSHLYAGNVYKTLWETIKIGRTWKGLLTDRSQNGKPYWLDTRIVPIKNKNTIKYVAIYNNVTQQYSENLALMERANSAQNFMESMPVFVFSVTRFGKILQVNKPFRNVGVEALRGTYIFDYLSPMCYAPFKEQMELVFAEKKPTQFELTDFDSQGKKLLYSSIISPVFNDLGEIISAGICLHEIFKEKDIEVKKDIDYEAYFKTNSLRSNKIS